MIDWKIGKSESEFPCFWFCCLCNILANKFSYKERSYLRNIVFDGLRCLFPLFIYPVIFEGGLSAVNWSDIGFRFANVAAISAFVNYFVAKDWHKRFPVLWSVIMLEFVSVFAVGLISVCNRLETTFNGATGISILCIFLEIHFFIMFVWVEDIIFGDLD